MGMFFPGGRVPQPSYYLTAYDVAKRHGYRGSEADFAAALIRAASDKTEFWCITPEMYGAYGDGQTDDTDAIRTAIEAAIEQDVPLVCNGTYIITRTQEIECRGNLTMIGTGTFKRKDEFIVEATKSSIMIRILSYAHSKILIDGLTFDGNRSGQNLDEAKLAGNPYYYEHAHSFSVAPKEDGGTVIYRNLYTKGRIGDGFNISSNNKVEYVWDDTLNKDENEKKKTALSRSYRFDNVLFENITGNEGDWKRGDVCATAPCKNLTFRSCNVGHLETELNMPEYNANAIFCSDCHVYNWLELGSNAAAYQKVYLDGVHLDGGVLELYGEIHANNCDLSSTYDGASYDPEIHMFGGMISNCRIASTKKINISHESYGSVYAERDPEYPDFRLKNCTLRYTGTECMLGGACANSSFKATIEGCVFDGIPENETAETSRSTMLRHYAGTVKLINNVIYGRGIDHNGKTMSTGDTLHIIGNTFHNKGVVAYSVGLPKTSVTWEIDFISCDNKVFGLSDYVGIVNIPYIRSNMHFYDTVYCSADPAQPMNGATYIQPAGVIKVATTNAAPGLKTVSLG